MRFAAPGRCGGICTLPGPGRGIRCATALRDRLKGIGGEWRLFAVRA
jgi:hypothetical protein